jgi:hypothetical protein
MQAIAVNQYGAEPTQGAGPQRLGVDGLAADSQAA